MTTPARVVVALGGNALTVSDEGSPSVVDEAQAAATAFDLIAPVLATTPHLLITHGNGPQVGTLLLRAELSTRAAGLPRLPLDSLVADTAGGIGYLLARELRNALRRRGATRKVATVLTQILVEPSDSDPTKPIGPRYARTDPPVDAAQYRAVSDGRVRRVVASPPPVEVLELDAIRALFDSGVLTIAGGGGGVAVQHDPIGYRGVEAVIDKDLTSSLLARLLDASLLLILTNIDAVRVNFGTEQERPIGDISVPELQQLLHEGAFGEGSMEPKVEAALTFAESQPGRRSVICHLRDAQRGLDGGAGTQVRNEPG